MQIFIEENKGDYFVREWEEDFEEQYENIVKMLLNDNFIHVDTHMDFLNQYEIYVRGNEQKILTILCC